MAFLKLKTKTENITVDVPEGSAADVRALMANLNAEEIKILRKVSENQPVKMMAIAQAKKFV